MPETNPNDAQPRGLLQRTADEVYQREDPRRVFERRVLGPGDQEGVDVREGGVSGAGGGRVDEVVAGEEEGGGERGRGYGAREEVGEDAVVAVVVGVDAGEGGVGFEDGEADGGGHGGGRGGLMGVRNSVGRGNEAMIS